MSDFAEPAPEPERDPDAETGLGPHHGEHTYESATRRLEQVIARLDSGEAELRETLELVREGKALVELCKAELDAVSGELEQLDLDALVASLDTSD